MQHATPTRQKVIGLILASALLLTACLTSDQKSVLNAINNSRGHNLGALPTQADAQAKAQAWAEKLASEDRIYHSTLSSGIGVRWCNLGENVGMGGSVDQIHNAYMSSAGHRANIMNPVWNGVGVGHATNTKHGYTKVFTVHVFIRTC